MLPFKVRGCCSEKTLWMDWLLSLWSQTPRFFVNPLLIALLTLKTKYLLRNLFMRGQTCALHMPIISVGGIQQTLIYEFVADDILEFAAKQQFKFSSRVALSASLLVHSLPSLQKSHTHCLLFLAFADYVHFLLIFSLFFFLFSDLSFSLVFS